ncbi:hypothetical protein DVH24_019141 [Malus domestica]|uniref:Uncharacterized protein n=2 Tax=Malus domestica TaxID=3750 RepID=A0A498I572_MALDO|nr:hypothetical protein DVH24_019141 [Malus domestica]
MVGYQIRPKPGSVKCYNPIKTLAAALDKTSFRSPCIISHSAANFPFLSTLRRSRALSSTLSLSLSCCVWIGEIAIAEMKVVAAYLLAVLGGKTTPTAEDLKDILGSVGAEADDDRIQLLLSEVKGKDITELIASGREKLASVPAGGGGAVAVAATGGGGGAAAAPAAAEAKKEEKVEEKEESDDDMGFSLFD